MAQWEGGGFITIINYAAGTEAQQESHFLITQSGIDILTQASLNILVQSP